MSAQAARTVKLSPRLESIAGLVTRGNRLADIGTDHAYLPIFLCQREIIPSAIAADLRPGPLEAAAANIRRAGLEDRIQTRLSDGLAGFREGEADTLTLAGMGGRLICRILREKPDLVRQFREILLQPQSEIGEVRSFLMQQAYCITDETCTEDEGKFYPVIRAVPGGDSHMLPEAELAYGPCLLKNRDPLLEKWLRNKLDNTDTILRDLQRRSSRSASQRYEELKKEEQLLKTALSYYEM